MTATVTRCGCGSEYTLEQFYRLGLPVYWGPDFIADGRTLESRQCPVTPAGKPCGSHCSIVVDERGVYAPLEPEPSFGARVSAAIGAARGAL